MLNNLSMLETVLSRRSSSFTFLNITQFLGALNDNIYKLLIVYFLIGLEGQENSSTILSLTGAIFVLPFLIFSAPAGTLADKYSKSNIIFATKILEVITMSLGFIAFLFKLKIGSYIILFLMSLQSAIFGPSKYGIIPELIPKDRISQANGTLSFFTNFAIILGSFLASFLTDITDRNFVIASIVCVSISLFGLYTSYNIEYTPPSGSDKKISPSIVTDIYKTLKRVWFEAPAAYIMMTVIFGSGYFLFIAAYLQLSLIPYAMQTLNLSDVQGGYLFLISGLGIGTGSFLAGKISGKGIELGLIPLAALGLALGFFFLNVFSFSWIPITVIVAIMGIFGGLFLVPLDTYIQVNSPTILRGQIIAATNFISFLLALVASLTLGFLTDFFKLPIVQTYLILGSVATLYALFLIYLFFDFMTRFVGMVLCKLHFKIELVGQIPETPAIYVVSLQAWNDTLLLLGSQRRRIRFFIQEEHHSVLKGIYKLFGTIQIPSVEPLEINRKCLLHIRKSLKRGISVCIFTSDRDKAGLIEKMKHSEFFHEMLEDTKSPLIPLAIEKELKAPKGTSIEKLLNKIHCPAKITFGTSALPIV